MASLVHVLNSFHSGALSRENLFVELERILAAGRANESWLLETLDQENTKVPLPEDVLAEVRGRIEEAAQKKKQHGQDKQAAPETSQKVPDPDMSRTRLATGMFANSPEGSARMGIRTWSSDSVSTIGGAPVQSGSETLKGTGDVLNDRFVLEECVGAGGMSTVYKALDRRKLEADDRNPYVAVKVLNLEFRSHPDSLIALQRETKKCQSLAHGNIVRVYDFDRDGPTVYMTMEYLSGKSLAKVLRAPGFKGLDEREAMGILEPVARALIFAHENCIVHSDLKPANIILTEDGKVKVIDFGIARAFRHPDEADVEATRFDPGSLGALTPTYASPEMIEHREPDPRDDVYALACITYEMLTGRHPFGRIQATEARDGGLELKRRHLSRRQYRALKAALAFDREKRTPTVRDFLIAIGRQPVLGARRLSALATAAALSGIAIIVYLLYAGGDLGPYSRHRAEVPADGALAIDEPGAQTRTQEAQPDLPGSQDSSLAREEAARDVSLAAVVPSAGKASPVSVRTMEEGLAAVLDDLSCADVTASVRNDTVSLHGYVSDGLDTARLVRDLKALPGVRQVSPDLQVVDAGKCAVIDLLAQYRSNDRPAGTGASIRVRAENNELTEGDALVIDISTPDYETYVNVDYFSLDGGVAHLLPGPRAPDNQAPANYQATIGDLGEWKISKPYGTEMVTVIMTPRPLFATLRDAYEKDSDYLAAVQEQLELISKESGQDSVAVDYIMIRTKPKSLLNQLLSDS